MAGLCSTRFPIFKASVCLFTWWLGRVLRESSNVQGTSVHVQSHCCCILLLKKVTSSAQIEGVEKLTLPLTEGISKSHLKECGCRKKNRMIVATLQWICPKFISLFHLIWMPDWLFLLMSSFWKSGKFSNCMTFWSPPKFRSPNQVFLHRKHTNK